MKIIIFSGLALFSAPPVSAGGIDLTITGFTQDNGTARIVVMAGSQGYRGEVDAERVVSVPIHNGQAHWAANDITPGDYALIVHHDQNANDDLDRPLIGLPLEPYGYSSGAWTSLGLPGWEDVRFSVSDGTAIQAIHIRPNAFVALIQMLLVGLPSLLLIFAGLAVVRARRFPEPKGTTS
ncbi:MAG: DUF2141 domain-containing protein [Rhodobacteraceae bacterium]|nr:DUF2141 domain-containing protein [Paracoccaceae bacterium]